jgi:hypothetical protein
MNGSFRVDPEHMLTVRIEHEGKEKIINAIACRYLPVHIRSSGKVGVGIEVLYDQEHPTPEHAYDIEVEKVERLVESANALKNVRPYLTNTIPDIVLLTLGAISGGT